MISGNSFKVLLFISVELFNLNFGYNLEVGPCLLQYMTPCATDTIQYYLFSSDRPDDAPTLLDSIEPKAPEWIDLSNNMKIIIHGYAGHLDFNQTRDIRNAYLAMPNTNVIVIDWGKLANLPCYPTAVLNTKQAGDCTAKFLIKLQALNSKFDTKNIHAIGFSLGAHIASFSSNVVESVLGNKFARITGLDPALPFFATAHSNGKLDPTDAEFVDVIHTNAGVFGKVEKCGHVDFYVNGGQFQPACRNAKNMPLCSHLLAPTYFAESIISGVGFWGTRCSNYFQYLFGWCNARPPSDDPSNGTVTRRLMGEACPNSSEGVYFVDTNTDSPFAKGW